VQGDARSTILIWLVAGGLAVFAAVRLLGGGGEAAPVSVDGAPAGAAAGVGGNGAAGTSGAGGTGGAGTGAARDTGAESRGGGGIYVHIAGAVRRPGLIRVPPDTRVATALERAGGPLPRADLTLVNLAAKLQDGQQIVVPVTGQAGAAPDGVGAGVGAPGGASLPGAKIHLSTASAAQLEEIDGIGPALAGRILEYRTKHGGFSSLDELGDVEGIGDKRLATLRDALQP
jgi:competence protein ComEA